MAARTGLVLQGGGALGAFEYGALRRLYEQPGFAPDVVSGVSIGAINAACLVGARKDPLETLGEIWTRFSVSLPPFVPRDLQRFASLFGNPGFFALRWDYVTAPWWTSFYSVAPLREALRDLIDWDKLNASPTVLLIGATDLGTGTIEMFDNRRDRITVEHIVASGSLPPGFPYTKVAHKWYWDGGLFNNTPLAPVIECLDPDPAVPKALYVVNLFPNQGKVPANMLDVLDRMFELIFSNKLTMDVGTARKVDEFIVTLDEIERVLPAASRARIYALPGYQRLRQYKAIKNIVVIEATEPETVFGPFDFSPASIEERIAAGYRAAADAVRRAAAV
jgi:predicted acylesterase/phospholipase RssA